MLNEMDTVIGSCQHEEEDESYCCINKIFSFDYLWMPKEDRTHCDFNKSLFVSIDKIWMFSRQLSFLFQSKFQHNKAVDSTINEILICHLFLLKFLFMLYVCCLSWEKNALWGNNGRERIISRTGTCSRAGGTWR